MKSYKERLKLETEPSVLINGMTDTWSISNVEKRECLRQSNANEIYLYAYHDELS